LPGFASIRAIRAIRVAIFVSDFAVQRQPRGKGMNERRTDFELLREFTRRGDQESFAAVVRRHIDLVYATALRKLEDQGAAEEVAQNVFATLARKAWQFARDDSLPAWLYRTTLLEAKEWLRGELRRRRREQTAAELGTTMKTPDEQTAFRALIPLLDEALLSLREKDRTALLLRFYESQSLRDVGVSLGVGEDAAQKRVAGALEKLAEFFQRRGFKTATVAISAAALQHTATSASAATASAVVSTSLQVAPPALAGLTALLARLASLSNVQTVAVGVAIAIVPVAWQWKQAREAGKESAVLQFKLKALRTQQEESAAEVERLRAESIRLEGTRFGASLTLAREQEALRKLENLKTRSRAMLGDENYHWPDDLPFVRIPKSALPSIRVGGGPATPAKLESKVNHFLDLSPQECEMTAQIFSNYTAGIDRLLETSMYETNQALSLELPPGAESRVFVLEPLGEKIRTALDHLCADLAAALGEDSWAMVQPEQHEFTRYEQVRLLGYTQYAWDQRQEIAVNIFAGPDGEPTVSWAASDGAASSPRPLRYFLPGDSSSHLVRQAQIVGLPRDPPVLADRVKRYLAAEAAVRSSNSVTR
jgi:RNA polymerase sigma factor (sigma-70 family)